MRTSRISRDTSRILAVNRTQRASRQTRSGTNIATGTATPSAGRQAQEDNTTSDSELSSVPEDSVSDGENRPLKKRKRGQNAPVIVKNEIEEVSITTIASPKKASNTKKARRTPAKK